LDELKDLELKQKVERKKMQLGLTGNFSKKLK